MKFEEKLSNLIRDYFYDRLITQKAVSENTIETYRTAIRFFLSFLMQKYAGEVRYSMFSAENVIAFLNSYGKEHSDRSVNHRLAVLRSLAKYACYKYPEDIGSIGKIREIAKRHEKHRVVSYLECDEIKTILTQQDINTPEGFRDHVLLTFMYNTGARVSEAVNLNVSQLRLDSCGCAFLKGKGNKGRTIPLWRETVVLLCKLLGPQINQPDVAVFTNRRGQRLTRKGVTYILEKACRRASNVNPNIGKKHISPHCMRHTTAMHLLQSGIDLNTIRLWLGHVSIETTNVYVEADLKMKREALSKAQMTIPALSSKKWKPKKDVLDFLENM